METNWIVLGERNGFIELVSDRKTEGLLPKGSFLTIENEDGKFILRVEDSQQLEPYSPSPLIAEMDLETLNQDRVCQNKIIAYRIHSIHNRKDTLIPFIKPQSKARLSNQDEIDLAIGQKGTDGPKVFIATVQYHQNQKLKDGNGNYITATLPEEMFYHQIMICGKTGSGKTVAIKHFMHWFCEIKHGAVLAINVKDVDLLKMDQPTRTNNQEILQEWKTLNLEPTGIYNFTIFHPAITRISPSKGVNPKKCQPITLDVNKIEPEALTALLQNISDIASMNLPNIFRFWKEDYEEGEKTFHNFCEYFKRAENDNFSFETKNHRGDLSRVTLHKATYNSILRSLNSAEDFFDNPNAKVLDEKLILVPSQLSVIDVAEPKAVIFGSIVLRDILHKIVQAKRNEKDKYPPVLIIIDEVHQFYNTSASTEALEDLNTISRTGRSSEIGVIFCSQNPSDFPSGLASIVNTKIFFKTDSQQAKQIGSHLSTHELESLDPGYAVSNIHGVSQLKIIKFPLAVAGIIEERKR